MSLLPTKTVTVLPASAVPAKVSEDRAAPIEGLVTTGAVGGTVSTLHV